MKNADMKIKIGNVSTLFSLVQEGSMRYQYLRYQKLTVLDKFQPVMLRLGKL